MVLLALHLGADVSIYRSVFLLAAASVAWLLAVRRRIPQVVVVVAFAVLAVIAIARTPLGTDLWSYQAYGRILAEHHDNPYVDLPSSYPDDAVMARVSDLYLDVPCAYGPVFVVIASGVAIVTGASELAGRLAWQLIGQFAVGATAVLLRRAGRSPRAVAAFLLHPLVAYQLVHLAHNDALVGLAILGGCLLAARGRVTPAALMLTAAALIKAPSGIAWFVLIAWLLMNRRHRDAASATAASAVLTAVSMLPFGISTALTPMLESRGSSNATSIWNAVRGDWVTFLWRPIRTVDATAGPWLAGVAIAVALLVALAATYTLRRRPVHEAITVGILAWLTLSLYPSVWYYAWVLPIASLWPLVPRLLIGVQIALVQVISQAWLFPVAAGLSGDGGLGLVDRLGAPLLGGGSVAGLAMIAWLARAGPEGRPGNPAADSQ